LFAAILPLLSPRNRTSRRIGDDVEERRKFPRSATDEPAYISSDGSVMSCVLCNISPEGAAIDVENPAFVPARFRLVRTRDNSVYECAVAWIRQNRIGLTFLAPPQTNS
jgi:hypothetical protein